MKYSGIILNDVTGAPGLSVSFFTQGCPHHCPGCHNPETWAFDGGKEFTPEVLERLINGLTAQGIQRNLCIMGGEPLCEENTFLTYMIIKETKQRVPEAKIYVWSGYVYEDLINKHYPHLKEILEMSDFLIDGPYIAAERDLTLPLRGSRNQRVIDLKEKI